MGFLDGLLKYLSKYRYLLVLLLITTVVIILNIKPLYLLTNDNYSPELNPILSIQRSIFSPAFREYRGLGIMSDSEQADIFRSGLFGFLTSIIPSTSLNYIYIALSFIIGSISIYLLSKKVFEFYSVKIDIQKSSLISSLIYLTTLWTIWVFNFPVMPYINFYFFLPSLIYTFFKYIEKPKSTNLLLILIAGVFIAGTYVISTLFFVTLILLFLFAWSTLFVRKNYKIKVKSIILGLTVFILTQLFWLLPFSFYVLKNSNNIRNSSVNETITNVTIDAEKEKMSLDNTLRFITRVLDIFDDRNNDRKMFVNADSYYNFELFKVISYLPVFLTFIAIFFSIYYKNYQFIPLYIGYLVTVWLMKNSNPPFGQFYQYLQENVSIFKQVFRWPTSKFGNISLLLLSILGGVGFGYLIKFLSEILSKRSKFFEKIVFGFICLAFVIYGGYLFDGSLISRRSYTSLPNSYLSLKDYINSNNLENKRILILPPSNLGYFREYEYGFYGSGFLHYLLPNPILEKALVIGSSYSEDALTKIEQAYFAKDKKLFAELLSKYNIELILFDQYLINGRYGYQIDWDLAEDFINENKVLEKFEKLTLYSVTNKRQMSDLWTLNSSNPLNSLNNNGFFDKGSYVYTTNHDLNKLQITNFDNFPINLKYEKDTNTIIIKPAFPTFGGKEYNTPAYIYKVEESNLQSIRIRGQLITATELTDKEVNLDVPFSEIKSIDISTSNKIENILDKFKYSKALDCSGKSNNVTTKYSFNVDSFTLSSIDSLACVSTSLNDVTNIESLTIRFSNTNIKNGIPGFCLYSNIDRKCINDKVFFNTNEIQTIKVDRDIKSNDNLSLLMYLFNETNERSEIVVNEILINRSEYSRLEGEYIENLTFIDNNTINKATLPLIVGSNSYEYFANDNTLLQYSRERSKVGSLYENGKSIINRDVVYQFAPVINPKSNNKYLIIAKNKNYSGFPSILCLRTVESPRCLFERSFSTDESIISGIVYPEDITRHLEISLRTTSYSQESINSLVSINIFPIPHEWEQLYTLDDIDKLYFNPVIDNPGNSIYKAEIMKDGIYVLNSEYNSYWSGYNIRNSEILEKLPYHLKQIIIPIFGKKINDTQIVDGWKQGWNITDRTGYIYAIFTPNTYSYLGYTVLIFSILYLLNSSMKEYVKKRS